MLTQSLFKMVLSSFWGVGHRHLSLTMSTKREFKIVMSGQLQCVLFSCYCCTRWSFARKSEAHLAFSLVFGSSGSSFLRKSGSCPVLNRKNSLHQKLSQTKQETLCTRNFHKLNRKLFAPETFANFAAFSWWGCNTMRWAGRSRMQRWVKKRDKIGVKKGKKRREKSG